MKFLLNGNEVTPKNYDEIELIIDKSREGSVSSMNLTHLIFVNEAKKYIENWLSTKGYFAGIPLDVVLDNGYTLNYYLDQTDEFKIQDHQLEIAVKKRYNNSQFWEKVNGTTFGSIGDLWLLSISQNNLEIGRVVINTNDHLELLSFGLSALDMIKQTIDLTYDIGNLQSASAGIGTWIYAIFMIIVYIIKLIALATQIIIFMDKVKAYVSPQVEKLKVMSIRDIIETSLYYLEYTLEDNAFINQFNDILYLGTSNRQAESSSSSGFTFSTTDRQPFGFPTSYDYVQSSKYDYTIVGGFLNWFLDIYNAKLRLKNNVVTFNRRDYNSGTVNNITTGLTIQNTRVNQYTPNTNESWQRCLMSYKLDASDVYTSYLFEASTTEWSTELNDTYSYANDLKLIKGLKYVDITFSQGFMYQSTPKKYWDMVSDLKTKLSGNLLGFTIGSWVNNILGGTIDYKDVLATSQYTYDNPKLLKHLGGLKSVSVKAVDIFKDYHEIDFIGNNSFMIHSGEIFECNDNLFVSLAKNDYVPENGIDCELIRVAYSPFSHKASLIYKKPSDYAKDLKLKQLG